MCLNEKEARPTPLNQALSWVLPIALVVLIGGAWGYWSSGASHRIVPYLRGQRVFFEPLVVDLGEVAGGELLSRDVVVSNQGGSELKLLGADSSCTCATVCEFPQTVSPWGQFEIPVKVAAPTQRGPFHHKIKIFAGTVSSDIAVLEIFGVVTSEKSPDVTSGVSLVPVAVADPHFR